jgi:hypothetical protein
VNLIGVIDEDGGRVGRRRSGGGGGRGRGGGCWGPLLVVGVDASSCHLVVDLLDNNNQGDNNFCVSKTLDAVPAFSPLFCFSYPFICFFIFFFFFFLDK